MGKLDTRNRRLNRQRPGCQNDGIRLLMVDQSLINALTQNHVYGAERHLVFQIFCQFGKFLPARRGGCQVKLAA